jgi:hypothetical protein
MKVGKVKLSAHFLQIMSHEFEKKKKKEKSEHFTYFINAISLKTKSSFPSLLGCCKKIITHLIV